MGKPRTGESSGARAEKRRRNPGRVVATALYWAAILYMVVVGFVSITTQVFWPETAAAPATPCAPALRELRDELLAEASARAARGGVVDDHHVLRDRLSAWDARYHALASSCQGEGQHAWADLGRLRHRVETSLQHLDRTIGPLSATVDRELDRLGASP